MDPELEDFLDGDFELTEEDKQTIGIQDAIVGPLTAPYEESMNEWFEREFQRH